MQNDERRAEMMNDECREEMMNDECRVMNGGGKSLRFIIHHSSFIISLIPLLLLSGCTTSAPALPSPPPASLIAANQALESHQPDQAIADAQGYLRSQPYGPLAAQAGYLEGRGWEMKVAGGPDDVQRNLFEARSSYLQALQQDPQAQLEGDIHASLSNVAFFQDDFAESIKQATAAMPLVNSGQVKASLLFRIGVSQQRLGRFTDADLTFHQVEQQYPGTQLDQAAHEHEGQHEFYVQLATYNQKSLADQALASLRSTGVIISERTDAKGNTIIDDGPFATYNEAKTVKVQLQKNFPQSLIVP